MKIRKYAFPVQLKPEKAIKNRSGKAALREYLKMLLLLIG